MNLSKLKKTISDFLKEKEMYENVDELLIEDIIFSYEIIAQCRIDLRKEDGTLDLMSNITRADDKEPFFQKNRLLDVYHQAMKNIKDSFVKLGLTPQERHKMKLEMMTQLDDFDEIFRDEA